MMKRIAQSRLTVVLVLIAVSAVGGIVLGQMTRSARVSSTGTVKTVGVAVYKDSNCSQIADVIPWGTLEPGDQKTYTIYVRNEGTTGITLSLSTENWHPEVASSYIALTWDYGGQTISPNQAVQVTLTLSLSGSADITGFNFDIVISATG